MLPTSFHVGYIYSHQARAPQTAAEKPLFVSQLEQHCRHRSGNWEERRLPGEDWPRPLSPSFTQDRVPFVVAERVPWEKMCETLNLKFMAEVGTNRGLLPEHFLFLAQKIFNDNSLSMEAFQHRCVSWSQFNKVISLSFQFPTPSSSSFRH